MMKTKIHQIIFIVAGILTIAGAILQLSDFSYAPYVFTLGTLLLIYSHAQSVFSVREDGFRSRRLARLGIIASLMLLVADYLMFAGSNSWVIFLLIYALVTLYLSFRSE